MDPVELLDRLEAAFPDPGWPTDWHTPCTCDECEGITAFIRANRFWKRWTACDCFSMHTTSLMAEAFEYFLPAYIRAMVIDPEEADVATDASAWKFLGYWKIEGPNFERFDRFDLEQLGLIVEWLELYASEHSVDEKQQRHYRDQIEKLRIRIGSSS